MNTYRITLAGSPPPGYVDASDIAMALAVWRELHPETLGDIVAIERLP